MRPLLTKISLFALACAASPLLHAWSYYRSVTIDHAQCGSADNSDFPVSISGTFPWMATSANGGKIQNTTTQTGGGASITVPADLRFTSDAAGIVKLDWEFESYDSVTGAASIWVRIPTVSHSADTVFYVFYDDASVTGWQGNVNRTWDTNFVAVWHFPDGISLTENDSTLNANHGANNGESAATGQIGGAAGFNGTNNHVYVPDSASLDQTASGFSVSAWVYNNGGNISAVVLDKTVPLGQPDHRQYDLGLSAGIPFLDCTVGVTNYKSAMAASTIGAAWNFLEGTFDGTKLTIYVNGVPVGTAATGGNCDVTTEPLFIGMTEVDNGEFWNGLLDEVRISKSARDADWIKKEYNNTRPGSTFLAVGSELSSLGGITASPGYYVYALDFPSDAISSNVSGIAMPFSISDPYLRSAPRGGRMSSPN